MTDVRDGLPIAAASGIWRVSHILLEVDDLERSVAFYEGLLGLAVRERAVLGDGRHYVSMEQGLGLTTRSGASDGSSFDHLAFRCPGGIDAVRQLLESAAIPFEPIRRTPYGLSIYFRDPDGYRIECHDSTGFGGDPQVA